MEAANSILLSAILRGRDQRAQHQQELIQTYNNPLISFTLNIPGASKTTPRLARVHALGIDLLIQELSKNSYPLVWNEARVSPAGHEAFFVVDAAPVLLKKLTVELEEQHPLGRLFDYDVFDLKLNQVNRTFLGMKERICLICNERATVCRRSKQHSLEQVLNHMDEMINHYFLKY